MLAQFLLSVAVFDFHLNHPIGLYQFSIHINIHLPIIKKIRAPFMYFQEFNFYVEISEVVNENFND